MILLIILASINAALLTLHLAVQLRRERESIREMFNRMCHGSREGLPKKVTITDADRREAERRAQENANFLNYDGGRQPKYDENAVADGK